MEVSRRSSSSRRRVFSFLFFPLSFLLFFSSPVVCFLSPCLAHICPRSHPWSTYAVHQTTLLQWSFLWDCLLLYVYLDSTADWAEASRGYGLSALLGWMVLSKFVKLLGHYIRYPVDFALLPVSIVFGYLHGLIKAKAMLSLNVVRSPLSLMTMAPAARAGQATDSLSPFISRLPGALATVPTTTTRTA